MVRWLEGRWNCHTVGSYSRVKVINNVPVVKAVCPNQVAGGFISSSAIVVTTV